MQINFKLLIILTIVISACHQPVTEEEAPIKARVSVEVVGLHDGNVKDELIFFANTLYLKRNVVTASIPAFITQVLIKLGDPVKEGQLLYVMVTKERRALGIQAITPDSSATSFGKILVKAPTAGIVSTLDKQQIGDYVLEGSQLCTIAESNALAFAVNVPYEFSALAKTGMKCTLILPDDSYHAAVFTTPLSTMNVLAQTQTILAKSNVRVFLPENLIVKVLVNKNTKVSQQIVPKACVLSDEMLEKFWVMKILNDSTAVKVDVTLGNRNPESVEILQPHFKKDDKFIIAGNYGLPDTTSVQVIH